MDIRRTQQCIKHVLTERWYAWEDAWKVARRDPEVDLTVEPGASAYKALMHEVSSGPIQAVHGILLTHYLRTNSKVKTLLAQPQLQLKRARLCWPRNFDQAARDPRGPSVFL